MNSLSPRASIVPSGRNGVRRIGERHAISRPTTTKRLDSPWTCRCSATLANSRCEVELPTSMPTVLKATLSWSQIVRATARRSAAVSMCSWVKSVSCISACACYAPIMSHHPACGALLRIAFQYAGNRLDLVAGIDRKAGADRVAGIEGRLAHQHLRGYQIAQHRHGLEAAFLVEHAGLDPERHEGSHDGLVAVVRVVLKYRKEFAEFHDLIDIEQILFERADDRGIEPGQLLHGALIEIRRRKRRELALEIDVIGDLLAAVAQLVDQHDADRDLALELVARCNADQYRAAGAPFAIRVVVAGAGFVIERPNSGRRERLVRDRRVDLLQERQRDIARQIDCAGRLVEEKARLRNIHVELFEHLRGTAVDELADGRLRIGRKQGQKFFLSRVFVGPIVEMKQRGFAVDRG